MHFKLSKKFFRFMAMGVAPLLVMSAMAQEAAPGAPGSPVPVISKTPITNSVIATINSMDGLDTKRPLEPGDTISYRVVQDGDPPIAMRVSDGGELEVPLIGRVNAAGSTCKQVAENIKVALEKVYYKKATVIVGLESVHSGPRGRIFLTGQVTKQGPIELPSSTEKMTVSSAILQAGGFGDFANKRKVRVLRKMPDNTTTTTVVDVKDIIEKGHLEKDMILQPGDVIYVPERLINF
ncbi:MAG: polysaccharide biosynthesis/export family protein [Chthoniobacterales bacterium]